MNSYDLAIIGSGPGGYVAGLYASRHKLKVAVIEKDLLGGTCLNRGCIPTKVMLHSAKLLSDIKDSKRYGIDVEGVSVNFGALSSRRDEVVAKLRAGVEMLFRANKIDHIKGLAGITAPGEIAVDGKPALRAKNIIVASGSSAATLPSISPDEEAVMTSDGILKLEKLPQSLAIIGGGVIGCEFASLFNSLGVKVTIVEIFERLIPSQSRESSKKLEMIFKKRGIDIFTGTSVESVKRDGCVKLALSGGKTVEAEMALLSVGRRPNTEGIGVESAGGRLDKGRIVVDDYLNAGSPGLYAIGDCIDGPQLAHKASYDGILACDNILGRKRKRDYSRVPSCIYTDPEIASIGLGEEEAKARHADAKIAKFPYLASGKAYLEGKTEGFIKIIGDSKGSLLGVEIFGEDACNLIGEASLAASAGLNIKDIAGAVHGHPTLSEIFQEAAHIFLGTPIHSI